MIFAGYQIIDEYIGKRYYKVNGFYDNGLISRTSFIAFKDILNYDIDSDSKLVLNLKKGGQFDYEPEYGLKRMREKLEENNVQEREIL